MGNCNSCGQIVKVKSGEFYLDNADNIVYLVTRVYIKDKGHYALVNLINGNSYESITKNIYDVFAGDYSEFTLLSKSSAIKRLREALK